ncbi:TonB-dependent receptor [Carboxylicivirga marina]|uniref:TonB-dependent receptor n=1 Tax=Carboxylicivirga marina TaxID=2800988 RepID=UPI0025999B6E|nr:TonB-dependent receptor [uncultured Carboxylicivirga sp.]
MYRLLFILFAIAASTSSYSQTSVVSGLVIDAKERLPLPGATVLLDALNDSLPPQGTITSIDGVFNFNVPPGKHMLQVSFMGFRTFKKNITVTDSVFQVPTIILIEDHEMIDEIQVVSNLAPTFQRGDTLVYNPEAYKVSLDATTSDLLLKMPGFYADGDKMMAMGDTIKEILVDGKRFFGNNVKEALENIPPDMIKKIDVFQYKSDEAKYSGFEDMNGGQTINIITKNQKNSMLVGEVAAGYGKDDRYVGEGKLNRYSETHRFNLNGRHNNVNAPVKINRGGGGGTISGNEREQTQLGANYGYTGEQDFNVRYNFNDNQSENYSSNSREYVAGALAGQYNSNERRSNSSVQGHNAGLQWTNHASEAFKLTVSANMGQNTNENQSLNLSETYKDDVLLNKNTGVNSNLGESNTFGGQVNVIRRLNDKGSALSANAGVNVSQSTGHGQQWSETINSAGETVQAINRQAESNNDGSTFKAGLTYNHAISEYSQLNMGYSISQRQGQSQKQSFDYDEDSQSYSRLDSLTSSDFNNVSTSQRARLAFKTGGEKTKLYLGLALSQNMIQSEEVFPEVEQLKETFRFIEPQVKYSYKQSKKINWQASYGMSSSNPSLRSLQDVVDVSNPLNISTGNPNLKSSSRHRARVSMRRSSPQKGVFTSVNFTASLTNDMVAQNRVVAQNDTIVLGEYFLPAGGQFSQPVNLDGNYRLGLDFTAGLPVNKLKSKLNMRSGVNYSRMPNLINGVVDYSKRLNLSQSFTLGSNINEKIDFTIRTSSNYSMVDNRGGGSSQSNYFTQNSGINLYYNFYKKFIFKTNTSHSYTGASGSLASNNRFNLNVALSSKLFKNNKGEIIFTAYDLTNNQDELRRTVDEFSITESYSPTLNQFYMFSFVYRI